MSLLATIKENSRQIANATAGTPDYFELATTNLSLYRALSEAARKHVAGRLLDAGAGRQAYRKMLEPFCANYESLDAVPHAGLDHHADLQDSRLPEAQYDSIFCTQVIQHLPEPQRAMREMARLLRPGGRLVLSAPHMVWLHNEPHDYWRFTGHGLRHLAESAGLRVLTVRPLGGLICFLAYAPSTVMLALCWWARPLFPIGLACNKLFIRAALWLDSFFGARSLYPTNFLLVADKPPV